MNEDTLPPGELEPIPAGELMFTTPHALNKAQIEIMKAHFAKELPGRKVIIVDAGGKLEKKVKK